MRRTGYERVNGVSAEASVDPIALCVALALLTLLGILEADRHRDTLEAIGIVVNSELVDPRFLGP